MPNPATFIRKGPTPATAIELGFEVLTGIFSTSRKKARERLSRFWEEQAPPGHGQLQWEITKHQLPYFRELRKEGKFPEREELFGVPIYTYQGKVLGDPEYMSEKIGETSSWYFYDNPYWLARNPWLPAFQSEASQAGLTSEDISGMYKANYALFAGQNAPWGVMQPASTEPSFTIENTTLTPDYIGNEGTLGQLGTSAEVYLPEDGQDYPGQTIPGNNELLLEIASTPSGEEPASTSTSSLTLEKAGIWIGIAAVLLALLSFMKGKK